MSAMNEAVQQPNEVVNIEHKTRVRVEGGISTGADDEGERKNATGAMFGYRRVQTTREAPNQDQHDPFRHAARDFWFLKAYAYMRAFL
jgi:hypothetical protein